MVIILNFLIKAFFHVYKLFFFKSQWKGNYNDWNNAIKKCDGYDTDEILQRCENAILKIKNREAIYERDSVLFSKIEFNWPVLAILQYVARINNNGLNVLDFGGSLGSTYYQSLSFIDNISSINWSIVEQKNFVESGRLKFENQNLKFYFSINECLISNKPNIILLNSVLSYIENPTKIIDEINQINCDYIIIDRTPVTLDEVDMLTIQHVPKEIYNASYPCWIFSESKLLNKFTQYECISKYNIPYASPVKISGKIVNWHGFILKKT